MYTQIILLLFALHSLSAYSIVQIELKNGTEVSDVEELANYTLEFISDQSKLPTLREVIFVVDKHLENNEDKDTPIKKKAPQEVPIELDGSLRAFTNGHGYQYVDWKLVDEHQSRGADKAEDKNDNDSDSDSDDADNNDDTTGDETNKHDDNHEVRVTPEIDQRHLNIDKAKTLRNKMFEKMKENYQSKKRNRVDPTEKVRRKRQLPYQNIPGGAPYNLDPTTNPDYKNRMLMNRAPYDNNKQNVMSPALRDEYGNMLYNNINTVYSGGRQFGNTPRAYGMNLNNDQGYPLNYINNMQNEPMYNYYINQPVQQRPIESTANNNSYKQTNNSEVAVTNVQQLPQSEINDIDNIQKFNQVSNHETINRVPKEVENKNMPQVNEKEKSSNNGAVNTTTLKHNKEMLPNVNQMNKKIGSIKEKVKDRFANLLNTPEGRKLLTHGMTKTGYKGQTTNDPATPHVQINDLRPHSSNLTTNDNLEVNPNNTIAINNIEDINVIESNGSNERNDTNSDTLVEVAENKDFEINEIIDEPVKNTINLNTVNQNNTEPTTNQTIVQNKCENPELPASEIFTTTCNETAIIKKDKDKESTSDSMTIEHLNGTASTETKNETCTQLEEIIKEAKTETPVANKTNEENCNIEGKCDADDSKVNNVSENVNFDDLLNTDEFWAWLSKWTTAYMEILNENIELVVKEEVAKQLEEMFLKAEKEMAKHSEKRNVQEELETLR